MNNESRDSKKFMFLIQILLQKMYFWKAKNIFQVYPGFYRSVSWPKPLFSRFCTKKLPFPGFLRFPGQSGNPAIIEYGSLTEFSARWPLFSLPTVFFIRKWSSKSITDLILKRIRAQNIRFFEKIKNIKGIRSTSKAQYFQQRI